MIDHIVIEGQSAAQYTGGTQLPTVLGGSTTNVTQVGRRLGHLVNVPRPRLG